MQAHQVHRRKSSKDEDENVLILSPPTNESNGHSHDTPSIVGPPPPPRNRAQSSLQRGHNRSASLAGTTLSIPIPSPLRSTFAMSNGGVNGHATSPYRATFPVASPHLNGHSRTQSTSSPFSPTLPSPLSASIPRSPNGIRSSSSSPAFLGTPPAMMMSHSAPDTNSNTDISSAPIPKHARRHSRMHSRNLSVFFPRPGSLPHSAISEDGGQELEVSGDVEAPVSSIPPAGTSVHFSGSRTKRAPLAPLGQGFTFGGRPPNSADPNSCAMNESNSSSALRRGHHHKHSVSHNFFSFLDPGVLVSPEDLHTQPTPMPVSSWAPISAIVDSAAPAAKTFASAENGTNRVHKQAHGEGEESGLRFGAAAAGLAQFILGSWLWVCGQQIGSLSTTGLGYWVVFDAFGVVLSKVVPGWLGSVSSSTSQKDRIRRPYGNGRMETVLLFSQSVYLMFSSVYVCKETVEHLLLSAGSGEGHHHHTGDEQVGTGIDFPIIMIFITFASLLGTAFYYENNSKLVNVSGNRIPSFSTLIRSISSPSRHARYHDPPPTSALAIVLSNPFVANPLFFCLAILSVALSLPPAQQRSADLILAFIIAGLTFKVAYCASVVLGAVLLQTSPPRGLTSGKMESFLRAMRELERHPHVLHLPAPHIWQLTASSTSQISLSSSSPARKKSELSDQLVVTLELHVREDLPDHDVLALTKWAWERCVNALGGYKEFKEVGEVGGPEITVGVVRG